MSNPDVLEEFKKIGSEQLLPLVKSGQISLLIEDHGKIKGVMAAALVNAPEDKVWSILLDYDRYSSYLYGITKSKVMSRKGNEILVRFEAGLKVMGVGGSLKYTYRMVVNKPYIEVYNTDKGQLNGYWAALPADDPGRVILVHTDVAKDVKSLNMFIGFLVERLPTAEVGLHVSPVVMLVNRMKQHMESG